jgi:hypothetical protein
VPIYIIVFVLNVMGLFSMARNWLAGYVVASFIPMEALSVVIMAFFSFTIVRYISLIPLKGGI